MGGTKGGSRSDSHPAASKKRDRQHNSPAMGKAASAAPILVASLVAGVPLALYILFLGLAAIPYFQRK